MIGVMGPEAQPGESAGNWTRSPGLPLQTAPITPCIGFIHKCLPVGKEVLALALTQLRELRDEERPRAHPHALQTGQTGREGLRRDCRVPGRQLVWLAAVRAHTAHTAQLCGWAAGRLHACRMGRTAAQHNTHARTWLPRTQHATGQASSTIVCPELSMPQL